MGSLVFRSGGETGKAVGRILHFFSNCMSVDEWPGAGRLWSLVRLNPQGQRELKGDWIVLEKILLFLAAEKGNLRLYP